MILSQIHTVSDSQSGRAHLHRSPMAPHIPFAPMARQASHMPPKLQNWKPKWDWLLLGSMEVWEPLVHCAWFAHTHTYTHIITCLFRQLHITYLSVCLSIYLFIYLFINSIYLIIYLSIYLPAYLPTYLSICLSIYLSYLVLI